jgi:hypothetical protein
MEWNKQNEIGISWNSINSSISKIWAVHWDIVDEEKRKECAQAITEITNIVQKMHGMIGD